MQDIGGDRVASGRPTALQPYLFDVGVLDRAPSGPAVQLIARDTFVADTSIRLDQLVIEVKAFGRELSLLKGDIAELRDEAARNYRFSTFQDREHRAAFSRLEDLARKLEVLKGRFNAIDGNPRGDYQSYRSLEDVSRRLTELGNLERDFRSASLKVKLSAGLFCASMIAWMAMLLMGA